MPISKVLSKKKRKKDPLGSMDRMTFGSVTAMQWSDTLVKAFLLLPRATHFFFIRKLCQ